MFDDAGRAAKRLLWMSLDFEYTLGDFASTSVDEPLACLATLNAVHWKLETGNWKLEIGFQGIPVCGESARRDESCWVLKSQHYGIASHGKGRHVQSKTF